MTGALKLTIGREFNTEQIAGFYTRLLRDEITAEWVQGSTGPSLHVHCHVSGEEKWLAPPILRNFIFRREMNLVSHAAGHSSAPASVQVNQLRHRSIATERCCMCMVKRIINCQAMHPLQFWP